MPSKQGDQGIALTSRRVFGRDVLYMAVGHTRRQCDYTTVARSSITIIKFGCRLANIPFLSVSIEPPFETFVTLPYHGTVRKTMSIVSSQGPQKVMETLATPPRAESDSPIPTLP